MASDAASDKGEKTTKAGKAQQRGEQNRHPLLPLKNVVVFPRTIVNLTIGRARSAHALNAALDGDRCLVVATQRKDGDRDREEPLPTDLHDVGTLVEVRQVRRQPDNTLLVEVEALRRVRLGETSIHDTLYLVEAEPLVDRGRGNRETEALMRHLADMFEMYSALNT